MIRQNIPTFTDLHPAGLMPLGWVMTPEELRKRTKTFALEIIRFCRRLPRTDEARVISWQLLRAGTGVGANYRAVCRFRSDKDFIAKLGVAIEEADEAAFWLELLSDAGIVTATAMKNLFREADELTRIFVSSRETARRIEERSFAAKRPNLERRGHRITNH